MIIFLTTNQHRYTHTELVGIDGLDVRVVGYPTITEPKRLPVATYIFTDLDRVPFWRLREIAEMYRLLRERGCRVLNDPARALSRFGLLRTLNRAGVNGFDAYRVDELEQPRKWPVFLRLEGDHKAPVSDLLNNRKDLDRAIDAAIEAGNPRSAMLIIEYAAEPVGKGLFRKLSVFKMGDRMVGANCVHDDQWLVKYGKPGIATPAMYDEEYDLIDNNPYGEAMARVFDLANVDYGRVDFGLVGGKPQIYEINSNPDLKLSPKPSPAPRRNESIVLFKAKYFEALRALDTPSPRRKPQPGGGQPQGAA